MKKTHISKWRGYWGVWHSRDERRDFFPVALAESFDQVRRAQCAARTNTTTHRRT